MFAKRQAPVPQAEDMPARTQWGSSAAATEAVEIQTLPSSRHELHYHLNDTIIHIAFPQRRV
jgi:hypothetical protein